MLRARTSAVVVVLAFVSACSGGGAAPPPEPASVAATPAPPRAAAPDFALGRGLEMRHPIRDGHLTIIPIAMTADAPDPAYLSLDDGMARKLVTVREIGSYSAVRVRNRSAEPLLVLSGELVLGGAQDHAFAETRVIAARSSEEVPVVCVEKGRSEGSKRFHSGAALVDVALRQVIRFGTQQDVWGTVDRTNARLGLSPPTSTYRDAAQLQQEHLAIERRERLAAGLGDPHIVGLAAALDGEVIAIDRFASPQLYRAYQDKLLASYVAGDDGAHHEGQVPSPADVRHLASAEAQRWSTDASFQALARPAPPLR